MSVLVFIESTNGKFKKPAFEAVTYGSKIGKMLNVETHCMVAEDMPDEELKQLGNYGASKIWSIKDARLKNFDTTLYAKVIADTAGKVNADLIVFSLSYTSKAVAPYLSAKLIAGLVAGAVALPSVNGSEMTVKKNVFSGKAFANYTIRSAKKIISILPNSVAPETTENKATVESFAPAVTDADVKVKTKEIIKASGTLSLSDAEIVVSGGRGMKGPENWGMLEEMAKILGAATACSRPVADTHWRPHEEHVGQTGLTIRPNLYIAVGISGAIQHLAGVNGSKVIVVINKDAEAPFFKAADYGIVGDAFEVVPKLNEALKKFKSSHN